MQPAKKIGKYGPERLCCVKGFRRRKEEEKEKNGHDSMIAMTTPRFWHRACAQDERTRVQGDLGTGDTNILPEIA